MNFTTDLSFRAPEEDVLLTFSDKPGDTVLTSSEFLLKSAFFAPRIRSVKNDDGTWQDTLWHNETASNTDTTITSIDYGLVRDSSAAVWVLESKVSVILLTECSSTY